MTADRIVAVGFLTQRDLEALGSRFHRIFPVEHDNGFDDLVVQLDQLDAIAITSQN